jgi:chromosome partitioning protein
VGQTIACANQKGGVGKTTTVVNLATYLALSRERVLLIDLDPQGNATSGLGINRNSTSRSAYDGLIDGADIGDLLSATAVPGLTIVPSSLALAGAEIELTPIDQRERQLRRLLSPVTTSFDYILIDCPPALGLLTLNALTAAESILIPLQAEYYALEGLTQLVATLDLVRNNLNPTLSLKGVVLTMYDARTNLSADVAAEVRRHLGDGVFETIIPRSVRLSEAPSYGLPIAYYRPGSTGAEAYRALADEIRRRDRRGPATTPAADAAGETAAPAGPSGATSATAGTSPPADPATAYALVGR